MGEAEDFEPEGARCVSGAPLTPSRCFVPRPVCSRSLSALQGWTLFLGDGRAHGGVGGPVEFGGPVDEADAVGRVNAGDQREVVADDRALDGAAVAPVPEVPEDFAVGGRL